MARTNPSDIKKPRSLRPLGVLVPYVKRYRVLMLGAFLALTMAAATSLAIPLAVRRMIDHGFTRSNGDFINSYFAVLLLIAVLLALSSAFRYYFVITLGERVVADLRRDVFDHVIKLSASFFDRNHSGEIVSRLVADTTQIKAIVGSTSSVALRNLILCSGATGLMILTSPKLSALALGAIPLTVIPLVAFGRSVRMRSRAAQDRLAQASAFASETIGATRTVQSYNGEPQASVHYATMVETAYETARMATRSRAFLTGIVITFVFGSIVTVLWIGAHSVLNKTMSPGTLGQFLLYAVIGAGSLGSLSEAWGEISQAAGAAERLHELLHEVPQITPPSVPVTLPVPVKGDIAFEQVVFSYSAQGNRSALKKLDLAVESGQTVAIVGPSGAGKTTLFSLLMRFYDPQDGAIKIDNTDLRLLAPDDLRSHIAMVPQDVTIFAASIHDNIAFGHPRASREDVRAAAIAAQADEFITSLEHGYDTLAGERGITLSGGQRQRIAIARALLKNAPILLLDEATSALDAHSETLVQKALDRLMKNRTTLVIAHRLATVLKADRILVMDHGQIVEQGTHSDLLALNGLYAKLARLQFSSP